MGGADVRDLFPEAQRLPTEAEIDERYTTRATVEWCLKRAGLLRFTLDVAACRESHHADAWFSKADDGLTQAWFGDVWCNPPYSDIEPWVRRAITSVTVEGSARSVSMLIPANRTEQVWWQRLIEPIRDRSPLLRSYFLPGRTRFGHPGNPEGVGVGSPPFGCVLLVFRREAA